MATRLHSYLGPTLVLVFCLSQAFRDVYFGHVFQGIDFFGVILLAFLTSTVCLLPFRCCATGTHSQSCTDKCGPC